MRALLVGIFWFAFPFLLASVRRKNLMIPAALISVFIALQFASLSSSIRDIETALANYTWPTLIAFVLLFAVVLIFLAITRHIANAAPVETTAKQILEGITERIGASTEIVGTLLLAIPALVLALFFGLWTSEKSPKQQPSPSRTEIAVQAIDVGPLVEFVLKRLRIEAPPILSNANVAGETRETIARHRTSALERVATLSAPPTRVAEARSRVENIEKTFLDNLGATLDQAAARGLSDVAARLLRQLPDQIKPVGSQEAAESLARLLEKAQKNLDRSSVPDRSAAARELANGVTKELETLAASAMEDKAKQLLISGRTEAQLAGQQAAAQRGFQLAGDARRQMEAVVDDLAGQLKREQDIRSVEAEKADKQQEELRKQQWATIASGIAKSDNERRQTIVTEQERSRQNLRHELLNAGFGLCEDQDVTGRAVSGGSNGFNVRSIPECARACRRMSLSCDGFSTTDQGGSYYCMVFSGARVSGSYPGKMSGLRGQC